MDQILKVQSDVSPARLKTMFTVEYYRLIRCMPKTNTKMTVNAKSHGIAYLLGRGDVKSSLILFPKNDDSYIIDFFFHCEEMHIAQGYCGSDQFQNAFILAMRRMESSAETEESSPSSKVKKERTVEKEATLTTVTSGRKTNFTNLEMSPIRKNDDELEQAITFEKQTSMPFSPMKTCPQSLSPPNKPDESTSCVEGSPLPVKTVEFADKGTPSGGSVSSPEKPSFTEDEQSEACSKKTSLTEDEQSEACSQKPSLTEDEPKETPNSRGSTLRKRSNRNSSKSPSYDIPWCEMWSSMKSNDGWSHMQGTGLSAWFYVHPTCEGLKKTELMRDKVEGQDYFTSEEDVKKYARVNLGWKWEDYSESVDSPKELAERVKKRKRGVAQVAKVEVKPVLEKKSKAKQTKQHTKGTKKEQGNASKAKTKTVAPASTKRDSDPSSPESQSSEYSHFSQGSEVSLSTSVAKRTRSKAVDSPTVSEMEVDMGVKKSAKKKNAGKKLKFAQAKESEMSAESMSAEDSSTSSGSNAGSSGSESPSEQSSIDATYQVIPSRDAWRILVKYFDFKYDSGKYYCLPGKENRPGKDSNAVEGINYFGSLEELRKNLCAYGLPEVIMFLNEEEVCDIERWVRYAHVMGLCDGALINPHDLGPPISWPTAWAMLRKLGMKFSSVYQYPDTADDGSNKAPLKFERQQDYLLHLAQFGIPRVEGIRQSEVLNGEKRMKLDLYIASTEVDTFKRIDPNCENVNEITPRRAKRSSTAAATELSKPAVRNITRTPAVQIKQTSKIRSFQMEFNKLEEQRSFPQQLMKSENARSMLIDNYNFSMLERDGEEYYCLPNVALTEGENSMLGRDYFETLQDMRENLCAFGLPPIAKGSKLTDTNVEDLDLWIRFANTEALCDNDDVPASASAVITGCGHET